MCDRDCFNCSKPDCDNDDLTRDERISQDVRDRFALYDRKYGAERSLVERQKKYEASEKGEVYLMAASSADEETTKAWVEEIKEYFPGIPGKGSGRYHGVALQ